MYTIYADGKLLYAPHLCHEGCGVLSPILTVELNKAGSLEYTMPPTNALYDSVNKLKTIITVFQDDERLFKGRVLHDEKDFWKQKKTYCEGGLAFLLDSKQRPYIFSGTVEKLFKQYISNHNARVDAEKQFKVGRVTVSGNTSCENFDYPTTFDEIQDKIIDRFGGHLKERQENGVWYLDLLSDSAEEGDVETTSQMIEFGRNLLDITEYITGENVFTVLIPLGASMKNSSGIAMDAKLTIASVNNGKDYLENATAISLFGRIEKTYEWNNVENPSELKRIGQTYLDSNIELSVSLTVKAVDLHLLDVNVETIHLGDWVRVISIPHGLDKYFQCTKIVYDLENPDQNEYSFGVSFTSLTDQQVGDKKNMQSSMSTVLSAAGAVNASVDKANQAVAEVEQVISKMPEEYVTRKEFDEHVSNCGEGEGGSGTTFIPSVDNKGNLSWTNDGGLENPETVNIMGPQGIQGPQGERGPQGEQGPQGEPGSGVDIGLSVIEGLLCVTYTE